MDFNSGSADTAAWPPKRQAMINNMPSHGVARRRERRVDKEAMVGMVGFKDRGRGVGDGRWAMGGSILGARGVKRKRIQVGKRLNTNHPTPNTDLGGQ
ncbi:MAG TPA: hypothetical protein EYG57_15130 [Planctomycetes bacterium]|nr:hypothetical protein [Planctomycetota bacterium]